MRNLPLLPLVGAAVLLVLTVLAAIYGERLNPFDGIPWDAPKCTADQAADHLGNQCQLR